MSKRCELSQHEATKRTLLDFIWRNLFIGTQDIAGEILVLANCPACKSTLAVPLSEVDG